MLAHNAGTFRLCTCRIWNTFPARAVALSGKVLILDAVRAVPGAAWIWGILLGTSLVVVLGFSRAGSLLFWKAEADGEADGGGADVLQCAHGRTSVRDRRAGRGRRPCWPATTTLAAAGVREKAGGRVCGRATTGLTPGGCGPRVRWGPAGATGDSSGEGVRGGTGATARIGPAVPRGGRRRQPAAGRGQREDRR